MMYYQLGSVLVFLVCTRVFPMQGMAITEPSHSVINGATDVSTAALNGTQTTTPLLGELAAQNQSPNTTWPTTYDHYHLRMNNIKQVVTEVNFCTNLTHYYPFKEISLWCNEYISQLAVQVNNCCKNDFTTRHQRFFPLVPVPVFTLSIAIVSELDQNDEQHLNNFPLTRFSGRNAFVSHKFIKKIKDEMAENGALALDQVKDFKKGKLPNASPTQKIIPVKCFVFFDKFNFETNFFYVNLT